MRLLTLSVALALGACGPLPRAASVAPVTKTQPRMEEAIRTAREAFIRAAQAGDAEAMSTLFAPDVMLITHGGDTIRGRRVIAESLKTVRPGAEQATFWFARFPPLRTCVDGAYDYGEFTAEVWNVNGSTDTVHAPFVVRWTRDSLGTAQIQRVAFAPREIARRLRRDECVDQVILPAAIARARARQESSRLSVALYPFKQPFGGPSASLKQVLITRGWRDSGYVCPTGRPCYQGSTPAASVRAPVGLVPRLAQLRYRFSHSLGAVAFISVIPQGSLIGHNDSAGSELEIGWSGWSGGAMFSFQRFRLRAHVGPALEVSHWHIAERALPYNASNIYEAHYSSTSVGVAAGGGYSEPVVGPLYFDLDAEVRRFPQTALHGTSRFPPASVGNSSYFVGLGFGFTF